MHVVWCLLEFMQEWAQYYRIYEINLLNYSLFLLLSVFKMLELSLFLSYCRLKLPRLVDSSLLQIKGTSFKRSLLPAFLNIRVCCFLVIYDSG